MTDRIQIAPSILAADFTRLGEQVRAVATAGADLIHIDVMDGRFVPNITMGPIIVEAVNRVTDLPLDVHLMIVEPERYIETFAQAGANIITVHLEANPNLHRNLQLIHNTGCRAGVAINPHVPAAELSEVMHMVDVINVMTVNPGFGGQSFLRETMPKVTRLRAMVRDIQRQIEIEVDGGIDSDTAVEAIQAGATVLIAGSSIFNSAHSVEEGVRALRGAIATL